MASAMPIDEDKVEAAIICLFITLPPEGCGRAFWPCRKVRPAAAKGYGPGKVFPRDNLSSAPQNFRMLRHPPPPSPVPGSKKEGRESFTPVGQAASVASRAEGKLDWSITMASAQTGNQEAYRRLLHDITPYLRALAARPIRNADDIGDTVQEVWLTLPSVLNTA